MKISSAYHWYLPFPIGYYKLSLKTCSPLFGLESFESIRTLFSFEKSNNVFYFKTKLVNLFLSTDQSTIFFDSHNVSKSDSSSQLSVLDPEDQTHVPQLDINKLETIVKVLREEFNLTLFGVDIVVENHTGRHAIIDINVYPGNLRLKVKIIQKYVFQMEILYDLLRKIFFKGYDGFPNFFVSLMNCIKMKLSEKKATTEGREASKTFLKLESKPEHDDSGFDTCDSSDERKQRQLISSTSINNKISAISKKSINR